MCEVKKVPEPELSTADAAPLSFLTGSTPPVSEVVTGGHRAGAKQVLGAKQAREVMQLSAWPATATFRDPAGSL